MEDYMKTKKSLALLLSLLMLAAPLASCSNNETDETDPITGEIISKNGEAIEKPTLLTHIFHGNTLVLPDEYSIQSYITPTYDSETGNITCLCSYYHEILDDDGNYVDYINEQHIVTLASDGAVIEDLKLELGDEENYYISYGTFIGDNFIFLNDSYDQASGSSTFYVVKYNLTDGTFTKSDSLQPLFSSTEDGLWFYINQLAVDKDGFIYLVSDREILVLDENFVKSFSVTSSSWIDNLAASADGTVYATGYFENGRGVCAIDKATKAFGTPIEGIDNINNIIFGEGYDFYYTDEFGLYGLKLADSSVGEAENTSELIMDFSNSDVTRNDIEILKIIDSETIIASEHDSETYQSYPSIYKKADDIDLSKVNVIEIASSQTLSGEIPSRIVDYNKNNPGTRIIVTDYSKYNTDEDYSAGETKLATDILNGLYKPDIIIDQPSSKVVSKIIENELYTDLYTFIDKDDTITRDDLFSSVKRTFDDDGRMWGLTQSFSIYTIIGTKALLGERDSWTFSEMLDFASTLPEGVELFEDLTQTFAANLLFGESGYGAFIDQETNTAHFDSPEFIKYLEFIANLPKEINYKARPGDYYETRYIRYHNGEIALDDAYISTPGDWISLETSFNTKDFTVIGYPTSNENELGSAIKFYNTYIITSFTEHPETAWDFLKSAFVPEYDEDLGIYVDMYYNFPILKSMYDSMVKTYCTYEYEFYFDGGASWGQYDPEHPNTSEMQSPGIRTYFTEDDAAKLKDFIENKAGAPITSTISDEINAIINEEISAFTSGTRDAQSTANIIQSRVGIWLAEHE